MGNWPVRGGNRDTRGEKMDWPWGMKKKGVKDDSKLSRLISRWILVSSLREGTQEESQV